MKIRALTGFAGVLTMHKGEETECGDEVVLRDLLNAGYVEEVTSEKPKKEVKPNAGKRNNKPTSG